MSTTNILRKSYIDREYISDLKGYDLDALVVEMDVMTTRLLRLYFGENGYREPLARILWDEIKEALFDPLERKTGFRRFCKHLRWSLAKQDGKRSRNARSTDARHIGFLALSGAGALHLIAKNQGVTPAYVWNTLPNSDYQPVTTTYWRSLPQEAKFRRVGQVFLISVVVVGLFLKISGLHV